MMGYLARLLGPSWGNTDKPGPPTLELSVTQDPALCAYPEMHVALFLDNKNNAEMKETEVQLFSALCCLTIHNPTWQLISLKRTLPESSRVALLSENPATSAIRCHWRYPALFSSVFLRVSTNKWLSEVIYIGFSNELGNFLIDGRGARGTHIHQDNEAVL